MDVIISCSNKRLKAYVVKAENARITVLFLSGGGIDLGKERFREWQEKLKLEGISSLSFDFSGVNGSGGSLEETSLQGRIDESIYVAGWMQQYLFAAQYALYGVSMGGYIALGLVHEHPNIFKKLILQAPAAYSEDAHVLNFGTTFTEEIRKEKSYESSDSFRWLTEYTNSILFIEIENDEIIPVDITKRYMSDRDSDPNFKTYLARDSKHTMWTRSLGDSQVRDRIFQQIISFFQ